MKKINDLRAIPGGKASLEDRIKNLESGINLSWEILTTMALAPDGIVSVADSDKDIVVTDEKLGHLFRKHCKMLVQLEKLQTENI